MYTKGDNTMRIIKTEVDYKMLDETIRTILSDSWENTPSDGLVLAMNEKTSELLKDNLLEENNSPYERTYSTDVSGGVTVVYQGHKIFIDNSLPFGECKAYKRLGY